MSTQSSVNDFSRIIEDYKESVGKCFDDALKSLAESALEEVSNAAKSQSRVVNSGRDWGDYISQLGITEQLDKFGTATFTIHLQGDKYRLSHLLEHGHATRNGGRTRALPHFAKGQEWLDKNAEEYLIKKLEAIE